MLFEQIQLLYEAQLYEDVKALASLTLTYGDHNPELFGVMTRYQIICYQADALFHCGQFKAAEIAYKNAIQLKKMIKGKGKTNSTDVPSEVDVKYRLHECYSNQKQYKDAIQTLESITAKQRSSRVNLALAKLYQKMGYNDRSAVTAYKEVLRECALSMSAIHGLLNLGVKAEEVEQLVKMSLPPNTTNIEWFSQWIKGQGQLGSRDFSGAVATFQVLDNRPLLQNNVDLLACLGEAYFMNGDYALAMNVLKRVHTTDPMYVRKMDLYAYLLFREQNRIDLENIAVSLMSVTDTLPEPWTVMGYFHIMIKKASRAIYFAQKALELDSRNIEAMLLKGTALVEVKKDNEALVFFREALRLAPYRFEAYRCIVDVYVSCDRTREAITCAADIYKQHPSARALTLYGMVLAKDPNNYEKAKTYLDKAIKIDNDCHDAVYLLAQILGQQLQYDAAIQLLRNQLTRHTSSRFHRLLADILSKTKDKQGAVDHFAMAIRLDPQSSAEAEGLSKVGEAGASSDQTYNTFDMEEDSSDNEDHFRSSHPSRSILPTQFELDVSGSDEGESDLNSDVVVFS